MIRWSDLPLRIIAGAMLLALGDALLAAEATELSNVDTSVLPVPSAAEHPGLTSRAQAQDIANADLGDPARGYELLTTRPYLPPDFDQETFDAIWRVWEEPLHSQAAQATPAERRRMAFERYGLTVRPGDESGRPQQYVVDARGLWTMNCLACHQGKVAGRVVPGVSNSLFALETLTEDARKTKLLLGKKLSRMDIGFLVMPLGTTIGTTNAINFGVALMARRDVDLNVLPQGLPPQMLHHDHDAPAWWQMHRKARLYADDFAVKGHRTLMQFMLVKENGPAKFREWEDDFRHVYAYIESLRAPAYPFAIDGDLAATGEQVFRQHCSDCHGVYGRDAAYPEKLIPLADIGTDRARHDSLSAQHRRHYAASWFNHYQGEAVIAEPGGYLAPPLDGVWASAPYFHNGSAPTIWHVLHPERRPVVWKRSVDGYDQERVGLEVETFDSRPAAAQKSSAERRRYFDTREFGKSAAGHPFADSLGEAERRAVLEYLKTL